MKLVLRIAVALAALYGLLVGILFAAMHQPPDRFGQFMAKLPGPSFLVLPFRQLWMIARAGNLQVGDAAPDFVLETTDRAERVQLAAHRGERPVVLVFGSYT
ncbi:MAG: hypothetical protein HY013_01605 [Candidatus Solibacter usitatus]|nr:hypothetical protein [Candidatus Solibacter usitatus]